MLSHIVDIPAHPHMPRPASQPGSSFPTPAPWLLSWTPRMAEGPPAQRSLKALEIRGSQLPTCMPFGGKSPELSIDQKGSVT